MAILVTGGAGYIGSHTVVELQNSGYDVVVLDNLSNSSEKALDRVSKITGKPVKFYKADILDREALDQIFDKEDIDSCIHFAGLKAVGESVEKPWEYYHNNLTGTLILVDVLKKYGAKNLIFSSSATVYGDPAQIPITEECPKGQCTNPYGWTKSMLEQILTDIQKADPDWNIVLLRYFNPIGAHESGLIGENPNGIPNNLMPYITQVAVGKLKSLGVFGNDYDTPDGTGVRDFIHVMDLAKGHVKALKKLEDHSGLSIYNLGTGVGYSVLDVVKNFEKATFFAPGDFDIALYYVVTMPVGDPYDFLYNAYDKDSKVNFGHYNNPEVQGWLEELQKLSDGEARMQLVHKIQQAVIDDAAMDFVGFNTIQVGMGKNVKGYLITPNDYYQVTKDLEK